ncbi:MAG: cold shock domain-containing protein [Paracoccaceae bacterium]
MEDKGDVRRVVGHVKWFDPVKGFGFVVSQDGGADILLHANVLRNYGQGSIADSTWVEISVQETARGVQALEIFSITPPKSGPSAEGADMDGGEQIDDTDIPLQPGRVKWFDKSKGFGFANVFGRDEDIFVHIEVLRRSGFADLQPGEAIGLKVVEGKRGRMASSVISWDSAAKK